MRQRAILILGLAALALGLQAALASSAFATSGWIVYVDNFGSDSVSLIDTATNATVGVAVPVGHQPQGVAITPDAKTAYVTNTGGASGTVTPIDVATSSAGPTITVGGNPAGIAITPDGKTAYVANDNGADDSVTPITIATNTAGTPIPVGTLPVGVAITPDGKTAYVTDGGTDNSVTPIDVATNTAGTPIPVGMSPWGIAITPDGKTAYVANHGSNTVTPIDVATNTAGTPINVDTNPIAVAITPDGKTAYVANVNSSDVTPIDIASNTAGTPITVDPFPHGIAISPDGKTAYVTSYDGKVTPIDVATNTAGTPITVGAQAFGIAITPDQAPTASFTAQAAPAGQASSFDGSASSSPIGKIASYGWDFGDGQTATTTSPLTTHAYATPGTYAVTLTVTNSGGTSTTQVFTGQTVSRQGGPQATTAQAVAVVAGAGTGTPAPGTGTGPGTGGAAPTLSGLRVSPRKLSIAGRRVGGRCVKPTSSNHRNKPCRRPIRLKISYALSRAALVTFKLERQAPGRRVAGRCVKPTRQNARRNSCTRLIAVPGKISRPSSAGANTFTFTGKIAGHTLTPGSYLLIATPAGGSPQQVTFQIVG